MSAAAAGLLLLGTLSLASPASAAEAPVGLGTAQGYSVLAGQTVTNTGASFLPANVGVSPGSAITGFPPGILGASAVQHAADAAALQAQSDLTTAYNSAAGRASSANVGAAIGVQTLVGGVYTASSALDLTGALTLNGQGNPNTVFIFQVGSALTVDTGASILMVNGAQACNVFWQVGSSAALNTGSNFVGTIMALTSISADTGRTIQGRALARNGSVTLNDNVFTAPVCAAPVVASSAPATSTTGASGRTPPPTGTSSPPLASTGPRQQMALLSAAAALLAAGAALLAITRRRTRRVM
jgi:hypothetical protein